MSCFSCCNGQIDYSLDDLTSGTQILPRMNHNPLINDLKANNTNNLFPDNNFLVSFGNVSYYRRLNLNALIDRTKLLLEIKSIQFGDSHSLMLIRSTSNGKSFLYGYGSNENGQLGLDFNPGKSNVYDQWTKISLDDHINKGLMFWNKIDYEIVDIGIGNDFSIVTIQYKKDNSLALYRFQLKKEDKFAVLAEEKDDKKTTVYKEHFDQSENKGIKQVGVFGDRILIITNDNSLYIKGVLYNLDTSDNYALYKKFNFNVISFTMGMNHSLFLTANNELYAMGHNEYGEFGIFEENVEEREVYLNDFFVKNNLKIVKVSTGARHSLILCNDGNVYCFGDNSDGQCCGLEKLVITPSKVTFDEDRDIFIVDVCCGFNHSIAKAKDGRVFFWGDSAWNKLGVKESRIDQFVPIEMSDMKIKNVVGLFAGPMQSAVYISGGFENLQ